MRRALTANLTAVLAMVLAMALIQPGAASATVSPGMVPPPNYYHPTLSQAESALKGQTVGPNAYTDYGKSTITGWSTSGKYTKAVTKVVYVSPAGVMTSSILRPNSWYNPFSWDWGHILGSTWNAIWNNCVSGATNGTVGTASVDLAKKLLDRGAALVISPEGYLAVAIGGCFTTLVFGS